MSSDDWDSDANGMDAHDTNNGKDEKTEDDELEGWGAPVAVNDEGWDDAPAATDDDGFGDSETPMNVPILGTRQASFVVLDAAAIEEKQAKLVAQMSEILGVNAEEARLLLRARQWKWKKLQDDWLDDSDKVRQEVGLTSADNRPKDTAVRTLPDGRKVVQCLTAYCDEVPVEKAHALSGCSHWFCEDCWKGHLTSEIKRGRECINTRCPGMRCTLNHNHKFGCACRELVPESLFSRFITDKEDLSKYKRWLLDSFVEGQKNIKWCPKPGCNLAVAYDGGSTKAIICQCGYSWCFSCGDEAHVPSPCDLVKKWNEKEKTDDATAIWLAARTKECPKCNVRIEKNKACNHMKCVKCGHDFCWLCKGPWSSHGSSTGGFYVCNKYEADVKEGKIGEEETKIRENQQVLQKYTYYYKRFKSAMDGVKFTQNTLRHQIDERFKKEDINKYAFLLEAVDGLISSRRVLQWTFVMGYYLKSSSQKQLFEYQQDLLLENTEQLQDLLENQMDNLEKLLDSRKDIINRTGSIRKFRQEMVAQVERGEFEDLLLSKADAGMSSGWCCSSCRVDNKKDATICVSCTACKLHGEMECKACKAPNKH